MSEKVTKDRRGRVLLNRFDRYVDVARESSSRGAAFIYALFGILAQIAHNSLLAYDVSLFENTYLRIGQAIVVALAVSFALMYFVLTADGKDFSKSTSTIQTFFVLEVFLNTVYYLKKIVFDNMYEQISVNQGFDNFNWYSINWFMLLFALPFAYFIPYIIKSYAGSIQAHKPALALDDDDFVKTNALSEVQTTLQELKDSIDGRIQKAVDEIDMPETLTEEQFKTIASEQASRLIENLEEPERIDIDEMTKNISSHIKTTLLNHIDKELEPIDRIVAFMEAPNVSDEKIKNLEDAFDRYKTDILKAMPQEFDSVQFRKLLNNDIEAKIQEVKSVIPNSNAGSIQQIRDELTNLKNLYQKNYNKITSNIESIEKNALMSGTDIKLASGDREQIIKLHKQ